MRFERRIVLRFLGWLVGLVLMAGQLQAVDDDGGQAGEFLRYGVGARAMSLGGAYTALADDATGFFLNPAGLSSVIRKDLSTYYSSVYGGGDLITVGLALPSNELRLGRPLNHIIGESVSIGFGASNVLSPKFERRDEMDNFQGDFKILQGILLASAACEHQWSSLLFAFGCGLKWDYLAFDDVTYHNISTDLGVQFRFSEKLTRRIRIGMALQNLDVFASGGSSKSEEYPNLFRAGVALGLWHKSYEQKVIPSILADVQAHSSGGPAYLGGMEVQLILSQSIRIPIRCGLNTLHGNFSWGIGIHHDDKLQIDFASSMHSVFDPRCQLTISASWGQIRDAKYYFQKALHETRTSDKVKYLKKALSFPPNDYTSSAQRTLDSILFIEIYRNNLPKPKFIPMTSLTIYESDPRMISGNGRGRVSVENIPSIPKTALGGTATIRCLTNGNIFPRLALGSPSLNLTGTMHSLSGRI